MKEAREFWENELRKLHDEEPQARARLEKARLAVREAKKAYQDAKDDLDGIRGCAEVYAWEIAHAGALAS